MKSKCVLIIHILFFSFFLNPTIFAVEVGRTSKAIGGASIRFTEQDFSKLPDMIEVRTRYYLFERTQKLEKIMAPYKKKYGYGYGTIHHYGVGQIYLNRVNFDLLMNPQKRTHLIKSAINEFGFVLNPNKYPKYSKLFKRKFLPVVLSKRAEAYMLLNDIPNAIRDLHAAIKITPSYYNAYLMLSKCYQSIGNTETAAKVLEIGKQHKRK